MAAAVPMANESRQLTDHEMAAHRNEIVRQARESMRAGLLGRAAPGTGPISRPEPGSLLDVLSRDAIRNTRPPDGPDDE
jgi:hypothetical protein